MSCTGLAIKTDELKKRHKGQKRMGIFLKNLKNHRNNYQVITGK